jgi:hypothetical protein
VSHGAHPLIARRLQHAASYVLAKSPSDHLEQQRFVDRLAEARRRTPSQSFIARTAIVIRGKDNDRHAGCLRPECFHNIEPGKSGHVQIEDDALGQGGFQRQQEIGARCMTGDGISRRPEKPLQGPPHRKIVVDN